MKKIERLILSLMAIFVLLLSMGINISKMACDKNSNIYLGIQEFSCITDNEFICESNNFEMSCCSKKDTKTCCKDVPGKNCKTNSSLIQFDFETIVERNIEDVSIVNFITFTYLFSNFTTNEYKIHFNLSKYLLVKNHQPKLSLLQSFII